MRLLTKVKARVYRGRSEKINKKNSVCKKIKKIHLMYRTSDAGYPKEKPEYINNIKCLENALIRFPSSTVDWHIMCDNCSKKAMDEIYFLAEKYNVLKSQIYLENVGHGAGTFRLMYEKSLFFNEDDIVYFLENDYLHREGSLDALRTIFEIGYEIEYVTLYDHPDKYDKDYIFSNLLKKTFVIFDGVSYWRKTPNTTMTFAARISTLKKDKHIFWKWTTTKHPYDYLIFIDLLKKNMVSPMPGYSTHGETKWLSPCIDWCAESKKEK